MDVEKSVLGSLLFNEDPTIYGEVDGSNSYLYFSGDYLDFYNEILLKVYSINGKAPTYKVVKEYIARSSRKRVYNKVLELVVKEVKNGRKALKPIEVEPMLDILKREYLKEVLAEKTEDALEALESEGVDALTEVVGVLKSASVEIESNLQSSGDEELLLHESVSALEKFKEKFRKRKEAGGTRVARYGYRVLDQTFGGIRNSDLISILGSAKQFKSSLMRNIAYNALVNDAANVAYFTHEMSFDEVEASFLCLHINNKDRFPDFPRVTYDDILEANEEFEDVIFAAYEDLISAEDIGVLYLIKPKGHYDVDRFELDLTRITNKFVEPDLICIDSINLWSGGDMRAVDDAILRVRQLTLGFNNNKGIPVMSPFQIKRSHYVQACETEGNLYTLDAVRYYSEINTSSTRVISSIQTPEMKETDTIQIQNLLSRDTELFKPFMLKVDGALANKIMEMDYLGSLDNEEEVVSEEDLDKIVKITSKMLFDD